jgi:hypothetical protein
MKHRARHLASSTIVPARPQPATVTNREPLSATLYPLVGYQRLAIRVIQQALRDLDCASPNLRETAHVFLAGNPLLFLWCDVADIGPARVMARAAQMPPLPHCRSGTLRTGPEGQAPSGIAKLARARASVS